MWFKQAIYSSTIRFERSLPPQNFIALSILEILYLKLLTEIRILSIDVFILLGYVLLESTVEMTS
jgi:hypothetical protein